MSTTEVYVGDTLPARYPPLYGALGAALAAAGHRLTALPGTRDVWVRDFMPVPVGENDWVQFRYAPTYLRTRREKLTMTDAGPICAGLGITPRQSELVVDGGNVVLVGNMAVLTDRVFSENPAVAPADLRQRLAEELRVDKLLIVPAHPQDFTGHADGMLQPVDERTVLISAYRREQPAFVNAFREALTGAGLRCVPLPYNPYSNRTYTDASGDYINALRLPGVVLVPVFGQAEDEAALRVYEETFPAHRVVGIAARTVAQEGGVLHCITWTRQ